MERFCRSAQPIEARPNFSGRLGSSSPDSANMLFLLSWRLRSSLFEKHCRSPLCPSLLCLVFLLIEYFQSSFPSVFTRMFEYC